MNFTSNPSASPARLRGKSRVLNWLFLPLLAAAAAVAQLSPLAAQSPDFRMTGWATAGKGTTGGAGGKTVTVTTAEDLVRYMEHPDALIIQVKGTIDTRPSFPGWKENGRYDVTSNKTIVGLGSDAHILGAELRLRETTNVIIRNLKLSDSYDTQIAVSLNSSHVWIDHCEIYEAPDGLIDVTTGSDFVTVSWNKLHTSKRMGLCGRTNDKSTDTGRIRVTYHNNWFNSCHIRVPYSAWGNIHLFNNYYTNITNYGIGIAAGSRIVSEHNYFDGADRAYFVRDRDDGFAEDPGTMDDEGTIYKNVATMEDNIPNISVGWSPKDHYSYSKTDAANVPQLVMSYSGTGIIDPLAEDPTPPDEGEDPVDPEPVGPRDPVGLIAFYPLTEGSGTTAKDESGFGEPVNMTLGGEATWLPNGGVALAGGEDGLYSSPGAAAKIAAQVAGTGQFSMEIVARPAHLNQPEVGSHPARIMTYSDGNSYRNFMFGHGGDGYAGPEVAVRLRTTGTVDDDNGMPNITATNDMVETLSHYVVTFDGETVRVYRDGVLQHTEQRSGALSNWDSAYALVLGNETTRERGWLGELHRVSIFDKALAETEIQELLAGKPGDSEPIAKGDFSDWVTSAFPGTDPSDLSADPGGYGVPLLLRYSLGLDAQHPSREDLQDVSVHPDPATGANTLAITFNRDPAASDAAIVVEVSEDLLSWTPLGDEAAVEVVPNGEFERVTVRDPRPIGDGAQRFLRLRAELTGA